MQTTTIPAQILTTTKDTCVTGHQCIDHDGKRCRQDTFGYLVDGQLSSIAVDCNQEAECEDDCFESCGLGCIQYDDHQCGSCCHGCGCDEFQDADKAVCGEDAMTDFTTVNPDEDIERRINHHIRKTISNVLSEIVEKAICGSMKHTIDLDDEEEV